MSETTATIVKSETRISALINMGLSAAFFVAAFGPDARSLSLKAPDNLALDFLPQSLAIGFFAALVPAFLVRNRRRKGLIAGMDSASLPVKMVFVRALTFAGASGLTGGLLALLLPMMTTSVAYGPALAAKIIYGGLLAMLVTPRAVRSVLQ